MILPVAQVTARRIANYREMGSSAIASQSMRFYAQPSKRGLELQQEPQRRRSGGRAKVPAIESLQVLSEFRRGQLVFRITAWFDWLLVVLVLSFGTYTYKCLDYCLSTGVKNQLSIRAKEIGNTIAKTGQIPVETPYEPGFDPFISVHRSGAALFGNPDTYSLATAPLVIGNRKYVVEVGAPRQPIRAVLRETAIALLIGLVAVVALATWGSSFFIRRSLVPFQKIALAVQALAAAHPNNRLKSLAAPNEIESLCVSINDMIGRLEESFQIRTVIPAEALQALRTRLATARGDLAYFFNKARVPMKLAEPLLRLLEETERLGEVARNVSTSSPEDAWQTRTERLRFYLAGRAGTGAEHVCSLTEKVRSDLASEARESPSGSYPVDW
jgi:hypothetical protein